MCIRDSVEDILRRTVVDGVCGKVIAYGDGYWLERTRAEGRQASPGIQIERNGLGPVRIHRDHVHDRIGMKQCDLTDRRQQEAVADLALIYVADADHRGVARLLQVHHLGKRGQALTVAVRAAAT